MRIDEAFRRMIGGYWWLIGLLVLVASLAAGVYATNQDLQYQASARVQMSGGLASTNVQADAATQWLQGVITTPNMVRHAMAAAGLKGDPTPFATHSIVVNRVGVSTVNDVLVTTGNADRSVIVANSLVQQALKYANTAHQSDAVKMTALDHQISRFTKERDGLIHQLATAAPGAVLELQARIAAEAPSLTDLLRQRSDLVLAASERSSIGLLDPATASSDPVGRKGRPARGSGGSGRADPRSGPRGDPRGAPPPGPGPSVGGGRAARPAPRAPAHARPRGATGCPRPA